MAFIESSGRPPRSARGLQQSTLERAFSGVYSLPEGGRPEARAASNKQRTLESAFNGVYSLPEGGPPTEHSGEGV